MKSRLTELTDVAIGCDVDPLAAGATVPTATGKHGPST